jgi:hypothetical protein
MKRPYHVLSVVSTLAFGGDENRLASIVRSLDPQKFRSSLVLLPQASHDEMSGAMRPAFESCCIPVHQLSDPQNRAFLPSKIRTLISLLRRIRAVARLARKARQTSSMRAWMEVCWSAFQRRFLPENLRS